VINVGNGGELVVASSMYAYDIGYMTYDINVYMLNAWYGRTHTITP